MVSMYNYEISEGDYDEYKVVWLTHKEAYTKAQFEKTIEELDYLDFTELVEHLCNVHGFQRLQHHQSYHI